MKPRIFIGSSGKAEKFASAIHARLQRVAECTVWTEGAFGLSQTTIVELMRNLRDSDFGIFVFAPDDVANVRGDLLKVPRDNVVYEAGLFSGYLGPDRCFIVVPQTVPIRIPSDLLGMTYGHYEDNRTDGNEVAAVASFCLQVEKQIAVQGLFEGNATDRLRELRELTVKFETLRWIGDENNKLDKKRKVAAEIKSFCAAHPFNKHRLLAQHRGDYIPLFSAIICRPEEGDCDLVLQIDQGYLPAGFAYYWLLNAVEAIKDKGCCNVQQLTAVSEWLKKLPNPDTKIADRIAHFLTA
ncbi:MAG TPA: nucleotide-binding protein [Terriglobales bacterium]|nr:nucleotide-binding protein [Terriglobales bacterium]